ncbi:hypothetical protein VTN00DRAFT_4447 [Thermoascus crustaceus]|uniref:uncharacterized protein n=1 Tax=Thermoascus crustaceus TaxID=5088 RepID=UPI00374391CF
MSARRDFISSADNDTSPSNSFAPSEISRSTFSKLLSCYPTTVREVYRGKLIVKSRPKVTKKARNATTGGSDDTGVRIDEEKMNRDIEAFLQLDEWRFEKLPRVLSERAKKEWMEDGRTVEKSKETEKTVSKKKLPGTFLEKEDLVNLMEWKLKHGTYRPTLVGMIKTNQGPLVRKTTADAITSIPTIDPSTSPDDAFPKESLEILMGPLRGVGTATASLILSVATSDPDSREKNEVPFYSDELYLWLCPDDYPSAGQEDNDDDGDPKKQLSKRKRRTNELKLKYNLREYQQLWNAVHALQTRLNRAAKPDSSDEDEKRIFSLTDIEKVAYVLGHIDVSGYFGKRDEPMLPDAFAQEQQHAAVEKNEREGKEEEEAGGDGDSKKRKRGNESAYAKKDQKSRKRE